MPKAALVNLGVCMVLPLELAGFSLQPCNKKTPNNKKPEILMNDFIIMC